jgi:hypothetical protein
MTQKNGQRNYKHAYELQKKSGETEDQLERQRARREYDKKGVDRSGKQIDHVKPLRAGGKSTKGTMRFRAPKANMADNGKPARKK